jgi:hypothetical protein
MHQSNKRDDERDEAHNTLTGRGCEEGGLPSPGQAPAAMQNTSDEAVIQLVYGHGVLMTHAA